MSASAFDMSHARGEVLAPLAVISVLKGCGRQPVSRCQQATSTLHVTFHVVLVVQQDTRNGKQELGPCSVATPGCLLGECQQASRSCLGRLGCLQTRWLWLAKGCTDGSSRICLCGHTHWPALRGAFNAVQTGWVRTLKAAYSESCIRT